MMTWVGIVANANSGRGKGRQRVDRLVAALKARGIGSRVAWNVEERSAMVAEADGDAGCLCLVAAGGDGTVAALVNEHPRTPITVLPTGTENLFARHFGIRRSPEDVAETIALGRTIRLDLGVSSGRRFTLMAGVGFDAEVVGRHHAARLGHAGRMRTTTRSAYVEPVLRASFAYKFPSLRLQVEGPSGREELVGTTAFLFNLPRYALGLPIAPDAQGDDGLLDVVVFRDAGALRALHYLWMVFRGLHLRREGVFHRRASRVVVTATEDVPVQLDGDPGGLIRARGDDSDLSGDWSAEVLPSALGVMVPERYMPAVAIA